MKISEQIFPRSVALITTVNKDGVPNVMTASFVMPISFQPKYLAFSISPTRYTFQNLKEVGEFGANMCSREMIKIAKICGSYSGKNTDKFKLANLTIEKSKKIKPPLVKDSPISFECEVVKMEEFGDHFLVVGRVVEEVVRAENFEPLLHKTSDIYPRIKEE